MLPPWDNWVGALHSVLGQLAMAGRQAHLPLMHGKRMPANTSFGSPSSAACAARLSAMISPPRCAAAVQAALGGGR